MKTSKSPRTVIRTAYVIAQDALPKYAHRFSPKQFTQHQLFACLGLKSMLDLDYRGVAALDAGYDAEWAHELLREDMSIRSIIPPRIGRRTKKPPTGCYRGLMQSRFPKKQYGQRWQAETTFSMIKRRHGSSGVL